MGVIFDISAPVELREVGYIRLSIARHIHQRICYAVIVVPLLEQIRLLLNGLFGFEYDRADPASVILEVYTVGRIELNNRQFAYRGVIRQFKSAVTQIQSISDGVAYYVGDQVAPRDILPHLTHVGVVNGDSIQVSDTNIGQRIDYQ